MWLAATIWLFLNRNVDLPTAIIAPILIQAGCLFIGWRAHCKSRSTEQSTLKFDDYLLWLFKWLVSKPYDWLEESGRRAADRLSSGKGLYGKTIAFVVERDEAYFWLSNVVTLTDLPWRAFLGLVALMTLTALLFPFPSINSELQLKFGVALIVLIIAPVTLCIGIAAVQQATRFLLGYGEQKVLDSLSVKVTVSLVPDGSRYPKVRRIPVNGIWILRHSRIIREPSVSDMIAQDANEFPSSSWKS